MSKSLNKASSRDRWEGVQALSIGLFKEEVINGLVAQPLHIAREQWGGECWNICASKRWRGCMQESSGFSRGECQLL